MTRYVISSNEEIGDMVKEASELSVVSGMKQIVDIGKEVISKVVEKGV